MGLMRATRNWGHASVRAMFYGSVSIAGATARRRRPSQWAMYRWSVGTCDALGIRRRVENAEILDGLGQCVYVSNHLSTLDIIVVGAAMRHDIDYRFLAKAPLFKVPFLGWHLKAAGHIAVHRGSKAERNRRIDAQLDGVVAQGASPFFYVEGTRSDDGRLRPFRMGAFRTAVKHGLPIVPIVIRGTHELMQKDAKDLAIDASRDCSVTFYPPIQAPEPTADTDEARLEAARALRNDVHAIYLHALYPDADLLPGRAATVESDPAQVHNA